MFAKFSVKQAFSQIIVLVSLFSLEGQAFAMPWDADMFKQQSMQANELTRSPADGTIPRGYKKFTMTIEEAAASLQNPSTADSDSLARGRRLWSANCLTCHGPTGAGEGPVGPQIGVPSLLTPPFSTDSDGKYFAVLHYGQNAMPRYGYKFDENEKWDLINYLRKLQGK